MQMNSVLSITSKEGALQQKKLMLLQKRLGYVFKQVAYLQEALTHASFSQTQKHVRTYERLEFLGDALLGMILAETLYYHYPHEPEGTLAEFRSVLAQSSTLAQLAKQLKVGECIYMSTSERQAGGARRESTLEDCIEALTAAIYLDSDMATMKQVVLAWYGSIPKLLEALVPNNNPKGRLQALYPHDKERPRIHYLLIDTKGPEHKRRFCVEVHVDGRCLGAGTASSKKDAEQIAAIEALKSLHLPAVHIPQEELV